MLHQLILITISSFSFCVNLIIFIIQMKLNCRGLNTTGLSNYYYLYVGSSALNLSCKLKRKIQKIERQKKYEFYNRPERKKNIPNTMVNGLNKRKTHTKYKIVMYSSE